MVHLASRKTRAWLANLLLLMRGHCWNKKRGKTLHVSLKTRRDGTWSWHESSSLLLQSSTSCLPLLQESKIEMYLNLSPADRPPDSCPDSCPSFSLFLPGDQTPLSWSALQRRGFTGDNNRLMTAVLFVVGFFFLFTLDSLLISDQTTLSTSSTLSICSMGVQLLYQETDKLFIRKREENRLPILFQATSMTLMIL